MDGQETLYAGTCHGGPLDGQEALSRFPKGFLICDKPNNRAWIYEYDGEGSFTVRDEAGMELVSDPSAPMNRFRAAEERSYDVLALPGEAVAE